MKDDCILLCVGLAVAVVVLSIGVAAAYFHISYASEIIIAALAAITLLVRSIATRGTQRRSGSSIPKRRQTERDGEAL